MWQGRTLTEPAGGGMQAGPWLDGPKRGRKRAGGGVGLPLVDAGGSARAWTAYTCLHRNEGWLAGAGSAPGFISRCRVTTVHQWEARGRGTNQRGISPRAVPIHPVAISLPLRAGGDGGTASQGTDLAKPTDTGFPLSKVKDPGGTSVLLKKIIIHLRFFYSIAIPCFL